MAKDELLPCSHCGGPATAWEEVDGICPSVWCRNTVTCGAEVSRVDHPNAPDARVTWNTRYTKQPDEAAVERAFRKGWQMGVDAVFSPDTSIPMTVDEALAALQADTPDKEMGDGLG